MQELLNSRFDSQTLNEAIRRFNQLTAPVAAKAVEDTAFYRYGVLLSRNDVGFDAARMAMPLDDFHRRMAYRASDWPHAHAHHRHPRPQARRGRPRAARGAERDPGDLDRGRRAAGARPTPRCAAASIPPTNTCCSRPWSAPGPIGLKPDDASGLAEFAERIAEWQQKALREAKLRSSWLTPNADYEQKAQALRQGAARPEDRRARFCSALASFVGKIASARHGQFADPGRAALPRAGRAGPLSRLRAMGSDAGRSRQPPPGRLRLARAAAAEAARRVANVSGALKLTLIRRLLDLRRRAPDSVRVRRLRADPARRAGRRRAARLRAPPSATRRSSSLLALRAGAVLFATDRLTPEPQILGRGAARLRPRRLPAGLGRRSAATGMTLAARLPNRPCGVGARARIAERETRRGRSKVCGVEPPTVREKLGLIGAVKDDVGRARELAS